MRCLRCGGINSEVARFCQYCGASMVPDADTMRPPARGLRLSLAAVRRGQTVVTPSARYAVAGALLGALPGRLTRGRRSQQRD